AHRLAAPQVRELFGSQLLPGRSADVALHLEVEACPDVPVGGLDDGAGLRNVDGAHVVRAPHDEPEVGVVVPVQRVVLVVAQHPLYVELGDPAGLCGKERCDGAVGRLDWSGHRLLPLPKLTLLTTGPSWPAPYPAKKRPRASGAWLSLSCGVSGPFLPTLRSRGHE